MDVAALPSRGDKARCHGIFIYVPCKSSGFTLLELLIVIAVFSVAAGIGIPSFHQFMASNRATTHINSLVNIMAFARSEAITRGISTTLCQSRNNQSCESTGNWSAGWMLFIDANKNKIRDDTEQLIYTGQGLSGNTRISFNGALGIDNYIVYKPDGSAFPNGTFTVCLDKYPTLSKALILFRSGRLRLSKKTSQGKPINCS